MEGGGGVRGGYEHKRRHVSCTRHIVMNCSRELYSLIKIVLTVFTIEGIVALTIKGRKITQTESIKREMSFLLWSGHEIASEIIKGE